MGDVTVDADLSRALQAPAHRVCPRARLLWLLQQVLGGVCGVLPLAVWAWFDEDRRHWACWGATAVVALTVLGAVVVPLWRYAVHRWEVTDEAVVTRSGWFVQEHRIAPISRVQTVDVERGPLARMLRLATVTVTTASSAGAVELEGLDAQVAADLVADLTAVTAAMPGDAT